MVSKAFFTGSKYLVEDNDGRHDYLRLDGEQFLEALSIAGQKVLQAPFEADEEKSAYLKALVELNENYFSAREYEAEAKGKYLKHDERAERHFRIKTAEKFSELVADLHTIFSVHDALVDAAVEHIEATRDGPEREQALSTIRPILLACTTRVIAGGWYPILEAYYYSLSPGELVAEDRERRKQRIEGTEESRGIRELIAKPHFKRVNEPDLERIREISRESPGSDPKVWKKILNDYSWYVGHERDDAVTAGNGAAE